LVHNALYHGIPRVQTRGESVKTRLMALAGLALCCAVLAVAAQDAPSKPVWLEDYKQALATAREADKPIFLVFRCVP
jgi:hypothetical protein